MWWKKIDRIEDNLNEFRKDTDKRLDSIEKVLILQEVNLEKHMERSEHLENIVEKMNQRDLQPIKRHVAHVEGALKLLGLLGLLVGIGAGVVRILSF